MLSPWAWSGRRILTNPRRVDNLVLRASLCKSNHCDVCTRVVYYGSNGQLGYWVSTAVTGAISVFNTRFALDRGFGAFRRSALEEENDIETLAICILGDIKATKDHDSFLPQVPTRGFVRWMLGMWKPIGSLLVSSSLLC